MQTTVVTPIQQGQRTAIVDILRGWALLGVALMNYGYFAKFGYPADQYKAGAFGEILSTTLRLLFSAKSWTLLSLVFGYGFAALINSIQKKGLDPVKFFTGRMFWLFVFAFVNSCFFFGDVLKDYALMGLIFLLFYKSKGKFTFVLALALIATIPVVAPFVKQHMPFSAPAVYHNILPFYHSKNLLDVFWANLVGTYKLEVIAPLPLITAHIIKLACLLLGFAAFKFDVFNDLPKHIHIVKRVFGCSLLLALALWGLSVLTVNNKWTYTTYFNPYYIQVLSTVTFFIAGICWLYVAGKCKAIFSGMQAMGKMTLTNYMVQNVISMFIFSGVGFGLYNTMPPAFYYGLAFAVYLVQVFISRWWLKHFHYGPVEWLWRQLSYGMRLPIRRPVADTGVVTV